MTDLLSAAVYGHLVGDAIGVPYEFSRHVDSVELRGHGTHDQPPGTWSDDGALTMALLDVDLVHEGTVASGGGYVQGRYRIISHALVRP